MTENRPVLVVGAGPTGMIAAMELSRLGVPVRIIDKLLVPSTTSRALAVQARTVELMAQRGLADEMLAMGNRGNATTIYGEGKTLGRVELKYIESPFNFILLISQSETERILREQLNRQSVPVELGSELIAFAQGNGQPGGEKDGVLAVIRKQDGSIEQLDAAYMIAAEGSHSSVRKTMNIEFKGKSLEHSYALADLRLDGDIPDDELSIFLPKSGVMAVFPMGNRRFRMIATEPDEVDTKGPDPTLEHMQDLFNRDSHIPGELHDMIWSSQFRINSRMLDHLREGRVFFGGDSAHVHSPAGGQGMNTGIQDMVNLAWKLALVYHGRAPAELLETYETERLPVIKSLVETTEGATDAFSTDSPFIHALITHLAPTALSLSAVQKRGARMLSQIGTAYRESPLSKDGGEIDSVHAGDRMPDWATTGAKSVHQLLDPSRFTLLVFGDASFQTAVVSAVQPWSEMIATHGAASGLTTHGRGRFALVRPDGHVAIASSDSPTLSAWLERWLVPQ